MSDESLPEDIGDAADRYGGHDRETYFKMVDRRNEMLDSQRIETMGYIHKLSAWMIAQLFVANSGALALVGEGAPAMAQAMFVIGLVAAMACSVSAWWQSQQVYHHIFDLSGPEAYGNIRDWKTTDKARSWKEDLWLYAAMAFGVVSLAAFAVGAFKSI